MISEYGLWGGECRRTGAQRSAVVEAMNLGG